MELDSLVRLAASGNTRTVEDEWMRLIESPDIPLDELAAYGTVLAELKRAEHAAQAETLAWAAIETLSARYAPADLLGIAGPFLLALGESDDLRGQVVDLYLAAYPDREGLDALLEQRDP